MTSEICEVSFLVVFFDALDKFSFAPSQMCDVEVFWHFDTGV